MASVEDVLDQVDGLRRDAAARVRARFDSVSELAAASTDELTQISGIGEVMADRIHAVAAGAKGGAASARRNATTTTARAGDTARKAAEQGRGRLGKAVETATGTARSVADRAAGPARKVVDQASRPARKVVDRVTRRGR